MNYEAIIAGLYILLTVVIAIIVATHTPLGY
jgi:hypothetical protein